MCACGGGRSRDCESSISVEYLDALRRGYEEFLSHISKLIPVIRVNWSKYRTAEVNRSVHIRALVRFQTHRLFETSCLISNIQLRV